MTGVTRLKSAPTEGVSATLTGRIGAPPIPHEHGAWVMLLLPMLTAFAVARPSGWPQVLLLTAAVTAAYLARHPADLLLRGKGQRGSAFWMTAYGAIAVATAVPLIVFWHGAALLGVMCIAGLLFGLHAVLLGLPSKRRWDRSVFGEMLAVVGLTLSAPAALVVARGTFTPEAWVLWAAFALFFAGGVLHVKTLLGGARHKGALDLPVRWRLGRASALYHATLLILAPAMAAQVGLSMAMVTIAVVPVSLRALWAVGRLSRRLPPLKWVGALESVYALWFAAWFGAAMLSR
ncbi:MAG TPA: YwiC-like family protein [Armatimonadota bacterium]|jgi:hypothetical protein